MFGLGSSKLYSSQLSKVGLRTHFIYRCITIYKTCTGLSLTQCSVIQFFKSRDLIKIHNGITFDFYPGLSRTLLYVSFKVYSNRWLLILSTLQYAVPRSMYSLFQPFNEIQHQNTPGNDYKRDMQIKLSNLHGIVYLTREIHTRVWWYQIRSKVVFNDLCISFLGCSTWVPNFHKSIPQGRRQLWKI